MRVDLFSTIHKAIRVALFDLAAELGRLELERLGGDDLGPAALRDRRPGKPRSWQSRHAARPQFPVAGRTAHER